MNTAEKIIQHLSRLPESVQAEVLEWLDLHKDELLEDWRLAEARRPLKKIAPLE